MDVKAQAFEGLLEKAASEGKKGAGQYFTPRLLIQAMVAVLKPDPRTRRDFTIGDPACGSGGFLVATYEWFMQQTKGGAVDRDLAKRLKGATYFGQELVARPRRLALMNLYLHGLEPKIEGGAISLSARRSGRQVTIVIADTGVCFGDATSGGIGLRNVRDRLRQLYGDAAWLDVEDNLPCGARVMLSLPA